MPEYKEECLAGRVDGQQVRNWLRERGPWRVCLVRDTIAKNWGFRLNAVAIGLLLPTKADMYIRPASEIVGALQPLSSSAYNLEQIFDGQFASLCAL